VSVYVPGPLGIGIAIDLLLESPVWRVSSLQKGLGITFPTAQKDARKLVEAGIVEEMKDIYPQTFWSREIHDIAFNEK
jgi:predicted transcriptional regulator